MLFVGGIIYVPGRITSKALSFNTIGKSLITHTIKLVFENEPSQAQHFETDKKSSHGGSFTGTENFVPSIP